MAQTCAEQAAVYRRVIALYQDGYTIRQLEQHFQIPRSTLHYQVVKVLGKGTRKHQSGQTQAA